MNESFRLNQQNRKVQELTELKQSNSKEWFIHNWTLLELSWRKRHGGNLTKAKFYFKFILFLTTPKKQKKNNKKNMAMNIFTW